MKRLISERTVEQIFGLSRRRLQKWRSQGGGPAFHRIGRNCLYHPTDIENFIRASRVEPKKSSESSTKELK